MSIPKIQKAVAFTGISEDYKFLNQLTSQPVPEIKQDELLIKVVSNAINPTDWKHGGLGRNGCNAIPGSDASGEVVSIGSNVKGFKIGDHVSSFKHGGYFKDPNGGLLQEYVSVDPFLTLKYEKGLVQDKSVVESGPVSTFEGASSITLGLVTVGLSFHNNLKLSFDKSQQKGKKILIWGGGSATGFLAIQVAKKVYGLTVLSVSSSKHHNALKQIGADFTFDYKESDVVEQIKKVGGDDLVYALDTVSEVETLNNSYQALSDTKPSIIDNLLGLSEININTPKKKNVTVTVTLAYLARGEDQQMGDVLVPSSPEIVASHLKFWKEIPKYVNDGTIRHLPLTILPNGLGSVEEAFALLKNNKISLEKLIIDTKDTNF